jgi:hypothetical protein
MHYALRQIRTGKIGAQVCHHQICAVRREQPSRGPTADAEPDDHHVFPVKFHIAVDDAGRITAA